MTVHASAARRVGKAAMALPFPVRRQPAVPTVTRSDRVGTAGQRRN
jgi:hypothetical protein